MYFLETDNVHRNDHLCITPALTFSSQILFSYDGRPKLNYQILAIVLFDLQLNEDECLQMP